ncbi:RYamide receptor isoform X1 [Drosophila nasuta]|uniref:RYamide receptor isoform X1 n=1 Tax=Drosophila nasuta TaxID=42062 RepID=UPI00295EFBEC|nr:RYamide receptor isoform X1 [Drosophila nasuta]
MEFYTMTWNSRRTDLENLMQNDDRMYYIAPEQPLLEDYQNDSGLLKYAENSTELSMRGLDVVYPTQSINVTFLMNFSCAASGEDVWSSAYFAALVYLLYIPIFIFALLGNGLVCYIVQSTPRMRTVTNYFIANLALGDILMTLFCVPPTFIAQYILSYWPFGTVLCHFVNYLQAVPVLVSAYTLVAISIDRYIAIMWPLRPRITKRYAKFIIAGVWFIALATAFPIPVVSRIEVPQSPWYIKCEKYICREMWPEAKQDYYYTLALFTLQFILPLLVLIFTYTRIAIAVWGKRPPGEAENSRDQRMARSKRKMIKMMLTVVIVFTSCWLPFNILQLLLKANESMDSWKPLPYVFFAFHWLAMSHSCYNPIIYCYMNARFRGGFLQIMYRVPGLRRCCCLHRYLRSRGERSYEATGEMTFKYNRRNGDGLVRKPKIRIRNRRCIPPTSCEHLHHLHQHKAKAAHEFYANEPIFMCRDHCLAVASGSREEPQATLQPRTAHSAFHMNGASTLSSTQF